MEFWTIFLIAFITSIIVRLMLDGWVAYRKQFKRDKGIFIDPKNL